MISRIANWAFALFLLSVGGYLAYYGWQLVSLGGSWYYLLAGIATVAVAGLLAMRDERAVHLYALILAATVVWSIPEAGLDLMALLPRLAAWLVVGLWFFTPWHHAAMFRETSRRWLALAGLSAIALLVVSGFQRSPVVPFEHTYEAYVGFDSDWRHYGNSEMGTRFAPLTQINADNVSGLTEVWRYKTDVPYEFKATPIKVKDKVYSCAAGNILIALDAKTGAEIWRFNPGNKVGGSDRESLAKGNTFTRGCRGISYFEPPAEVAGSCPARIYTGTTDARLIAVNADTGKPCEDFGKAGEVNLREGLGPHMPFAYFHTSVPLLAKDKIVVGGWVVDNQELGNPSGALRAYDAVTGEFSWGWDVGRPGETGFPAEGEAFTRGTPNVWSITSYDPELDIVYAPTGNASPDYYGAKRRDIDEASNAAIVAIRGSTGEHLWTYRTVYHDIWDYDVPSQPTLLDIQKDGVKIPAVAAPTKRGEIFLLDRRTGQPIWPATDCPDGTAPTAMGECPVPQNPAPGEWLSKVQPFSGLPRFNTPRLEQDMWGLTPLDQLYCRIEYKKLRYDGHFTPPMPGGGYLGRDKETWGGSFQYPGNQGGFNWPSVSVDAENGYLVAQPMLLGNRIYMLTSAEREASTGRPTPPAGPDLTGQGAWDENAPRYGITSRFVSKWKIPFTNIASDMPCFEPPYGVLALIDLNENRMLWSRPIGNMNDLGPFGLHPGLPFEVGTPVYGGTTTTRSGLIFQVGTLDSMFRVIDIRNGKTLWSTRLPRTSNSTPITYMADGRQYVVVAVADDSEKGVPHEGSVIIAYALPDL